MTRRLLWTDDEGPGRFQFAARRLEREGWTIEWARSVEEATARLAAAPFDALVLDQMLPLRAGDRQATVWGGCVVLRWLRGLTVPVGAPADVAAPAASPHPHNRGVPVALVSAYHHDDVEAAMAEVQRPPAYVGKPFDVGQLLAALRDGDA